MPRGCFSLTDVQKMYLLGEARERNVDDHPDASSLTGVPCHVYLEFSAQHLDVERLRRTWRAVLGAHPALTATYHASGYGEIPDEPYSLEIPVIDLASWDERRREEELRAIRSMLQGRSLQHEKGQNAALSLVRVDGLNLRLIFDLNLVSCDVRGFCHVLLELHEIYAGRLHPDAIDDPLPSVRALADTADAGGPGVSAASADYWRGRIASMSTGAPDALDVLLAPRPDVLRDARYRGLNTLVTGQAASGLERRARELGVEVSYFFLAVAGSVICEAACQEGVLVMLPVFDAPFDGVHDPVGDFTELLPVEAMAGTSDVDACAVRAQRDVNEARRHAHGSSKTIQDQLAARRMRPAFVFSCVPGQITVGDGSLRELGQLSYLCSQTPQVALDIQVYVIESGHLVQWVFPEGYFEEGDLVSYFQEFHLTCESYGKEKGQPWETSENRHWRSTLPNYLPRSSASRTTSTGT